VQRVWYRCFVVWLWLAAVTGHINYIHQCSQCAVCCRTCKLAASCMACWRWHQKRAPYTREWRQSISRCSAVSRLNQRHPQSLIFTNSHRTTHRPLTSSLQPLLQLLLHGSAPLLHCPQRSAQSSVTKRSQIMHSAAARHAASVFLLIKEHTIHRSLQSLTIAKHVHCRTHTSL